MDKHTLHCVTADLPFTYLTPDELAFWYSIGGVLSTERWFISEVHALHNYIAGTGPFFGPADYAKLRLLNFFHNLLIWRNMDLGIESIVNTNAVERISSHIQALRKRFREEHEIFDTITDDRGSLFVFNLTKEEDDPFGPQEKKFMQTETQKRRAAKELRDRQTAYKLALSMRICCKMLNFMRKMRAALNFDQKFGNLPAELRLHIMRHTHIYDLISLLLSGKAFDVVIEANETATLRGIETEQFSKFKWLFGDSVRRSEQQWLALKDCIILLHHPDVLDEVLKASQFPNSSKARAFHLEALQTILNNITWITAVTTLTSRAALCFTMFAALARHENHADAMERRIELFEWQPQAIQREIREFLEGGVIQVLNCLNADDRYHTMLGHVTCFWIEAYLKLPETDRKLERASMGPWIANLVAGYILEDVPQHLIYHGAESIAYAIHSDAGWFGEALELELEHQGHCDKLWKEGRDFAKRIGFDHFKILRGTVVGIHLYGEQYRLPPI